MFESTDGESSRMSVAEVSDSLSVLHQEEERVKFSDRFVITNIVAR